MLSICSVCSAENKNTKLKRVKDHWLTSCEAERNEPPDNKVQKITIIVAAFQWDIKLSFQSTINTNIPEQSSIIV